MSFPALSRRSRLLFGLAAGIVLTLGATHVRPALAEGDESASMAPDFTAEGLDGKTYTLSELLKEGPVYLDFWTTWCKPCQQALPKLDELHTKYEKAGFTLLTVASDDQKTIAKVKPHVKSRGWKFPVILDSKRELGNKYSVRAYPTSYLISQDGKVVSMHQGYRPGDEKVLEEELISLLPADAVKAASESEGGSH
ncbi:MAG: TlpA disulfide reductase family protein [Candidatus Eisenbacteria bacterium]